MAEAAAFRKHLPKIALVLGVLVGLGGMGWFLRLRVAERARCASCVSRLAFIRDGCYQYEEKHHVSPFALATNMDALMSLLVEDGIYKAGTYETIAAVRFKYCGRHEYVFVPSAGSEALVTSYGARGLLRCPTANDHPHYGITVLWSDHSIEWGVLPSKSVPRRFGRGE